VATPIDPDKAEALKADHEAEKADHEALGDALTFVGQTRHAALVQLRDNLAARHREGKPMKLPSPGLREQVAYDDTYAEVGRILSQLSPRSRAKVL
jgi:hypothetical protein